MIRSSSGELKPRDGIHRRATMAYSTWDQTSVARSWSRSAVASSGLGWSPLLKTRRLSKIRFSRELRLIDLVESGGLTRLGAEDSVANGLRYRNSQCWSAALRSHPAKVDGIYYRSRYDPALTACALFNHCQPLIEVVEDCGTWASQPILLGSILDHYQFGTDL